MKYITVAEPSDLLNGLYFSDGVVTYAWCIRTSGADFVLEENTGADAKHPSGTWTARGTWGAGVGLTIAASQVTSGTFADGRISESSVTQHVAALLHDSLGSVDANEHKDHTNIQVVAGVGLDGGGTIAATRTIDLADTAVTPGSYVQADITVDQQGRLTAAADGGYAPVMTTRTADETALAATTWRDDTVLTATAYPSGGGDGSKVYRVSVVSTYAATGVTWMQLAFHSNVNGDQATAAANLIVATDGHNNQDVTIQITDFIITPTSGHLWGIAHWASAATATPQGAGGSTCYVTIQRVA
jgi:hypothetical protein